MTINWSNNKRAYDLYEKIKEEKKWKSLNFGERMYLIERIGKCFIQLEKIDQLDLVDGLNATLVIDSINERGVNRTGKIMKFLDSVDKETVRENLGLKNADVDSDNLDIAKAAVRRMILGEK